MKAEKLKGFTPLEKATDTNQRALSYGLNPVLSQLIRERGSLTGFTLAEILTVIVIIALLMGILAPALNQVKKIAKETKQKAQIGSIEIGINLYKNDFGVYPPSKAVGVAYTYCGAQILTEALLGYDLLGFHPDSVYRSDGLDKNGTSSLYLTTNLDARKGPYLDRTNISVFRTGTTGTEEGVYKGLTGAAGEPKRDRYLICDVFTAVSRKIGEKTYKVGTPVLYFRANPSAEYTKLTSGNLIDPPKNIYSYFDNYKLMFLGKITDKEIEHPLCPFKSNPTEEPLGVPFYDYITDPMVPNLKRPVRPDSFILISAGNDGLYGTRDDICNFEPNLPG